MRRYTFLLVLRMVVICAVSMPISVLAGPATPMRSPTDKPTATWALSGRSGTETVTSTGTSQRDQGHVYYVATNGDDDDLGTEAQPFRTITKGISVLGARDTLYVKSGTYVESLRDFPSGTSWDAPVTVAAYPGDTVVVRPSLGGWVAYFTHCHHVVLDGFVLDGANVEHFAIMITSESHHIRIQNSEVKGAPKSGILTANYGSINSDHNEFINLDVHDNGTTYLDHGLYIATSGNLVDHCSVHHNSGWGVNIYSSSYPDVSANNNVVSSNAIYDNHGTNHYANGICLSSGSGNLAYDNLVWGNDHGIQVAYNGVSNTKVYNNVIYANDGQGISLIESTNAVIRNNIVYQNGGPAIIEFRDVYGTIQDHNLVDVDPQFVDASAHDFHLQSTSPAIDAGITLSEVAEDFDGVSRPRGTGYDIGAYESPFTTRVTDLRVVAAIVDTPTLTITLRWTAPVAAVTYTLRSSNTLLIAANWSHASIVTVFFTASEPGSGEWLTTPVDYAGGTLYLALKFQNGEGIWSDLSNNAFWPHLDVYLPLIVKNYVSSSST
jgi:parallel beta-helix repeat protein